MKRTSFVGTLTQQLVKDCGITGPNARASGVAFDIRKVSPYLGYDQLDFEIPIGKGEGGNIGDAHDRFTLRLREISQSLEILRQIADSVPVGEFINSKIDKDGKIPAGEAYSRIESPRGLLGCHVVSNGDLRPSRVQFRVPTLANLMAVPHLLAGIRIEDLPVVLASLDLGIAEADR